MSQFDGTKETKPAPERPIGEDVVKELEELRPVTHERNYDGGQSSTDTSQLSIFSIPGKPFGKADVKELSSQQHEVATFYVLQNCDESQPFVYEHKNMLLDAGITNVEEIHKLEFIIQLYNKGQVDKKMVSLARVLKDEQFIILDIVELCYTEGNKIVLFDCEWYDTTQEGRGYKRDRYEIITVNIACKLNTQETFVLACQAIQIFYTRGLKDITWSAVTEIKPRNLYEMSIDGGPYQEEIQSISTSNENEDDQIQLSKFKLDAIIVE
ncbi:hypothetical protein JRO89_XS01G0091800 [Xanthoceras sorbifolium]|uniref:DUF4216 domain-containing protein n=1 Tax=Xanthoceras sorbifolium TaxID=99658 RepID=A0ABQ8IIP0_9ROSI|nr:hypothetical protein JRO89_XS01G0091800 [Xanthoceras sorbifolium]